MDTIKSSTAQSHVEKDHKSALIYINKDYVVQWEITEALMQLFENRAYVPGEVCYKTNFNRDTPCEKCVLSEMFITHKPVTHLYKEGSTSVEIIARPLFDRAGGFLGGVLQLEEINARIEQENKIKELNHIMDAILNNIPVYLFVKDPANEFRYLYWNKAMAENTQIPVSKVLGKTDLEVFPSEIDAFRFRKDDLTLLEKGSKIEFQEEYVAASGEVRTVNTLKTLIPIEGKSPWVIGISWDITDLKQTERELIAEKEKAEQSNRLKSAFLANMSHEIRTPLNAIVGFSDLLIETTDPEEKAEYLKIVKKNNELLLQLISDILDLSKIEAQSLEFVFGPVDVHALCSGIVAASNLKSEAQVPVIFDQNLPECCLYTDRNRLN